MANWRKLSFNYHQIPSLSVLQNLLVCRPMQMVEEKRKKVTFEVSAKKYEPRHDKTNKMSVHPAKTQINLGIRSVWSVFAVRMKKAWVLSYPLSAQRMPRVIRVFAGRTLICWFCHVTAHITFDILILILTWIFDTTFSGLTVGGDRYFSFCTASTASATIGCAHFIRIVIWNTGKVWQIDQAWDEKLTKKSVTRKKVSRDMTKPTKCVCAQRRLGSAWASAQSDQSLRCPHKESLGP